MAKHDLKTLLNVTEEELLEAAHTFPYARFLEWQIKKLKAAINAQAHRGDMHTSEGGELLKYRLKSLRFFRENYREVYR